MFSASSDERTEEKPRRADRKATPNPATFTPFGME